MAGTDDPQSAATPEGHTTLRDCKPKPHVELQVLQSEIAQVQASLEWHCWVEPGRGSTQSLSSPDWQETDLVWRPSPQLLLQGPQEATRHWHPTLFVQAWSLVGPRPWQIASGQETLLVWKPLPQETLHDDQEPTSQSHPKLSMQA